MFQKNLTSSTSYSELIRHGSVQFIHQKVKQRIEKKSRRRRIFEVCCWKKGKKKVMVMKVWFRKLKSKFTFQKSLQMKFIRLIKISSSSIYIKLLFIVLYIQNKNQNGFFYHNFYLRLKSKLKIITVLIKAIIYLKLKVKIKIIFQGSVLFRIISNNNKFNWS